MRLYPRERLYPSILKLSTLALRKRDESRNYVQISSTSTTKQLAARPSAPSSSSSYRPPLPSKANQDKPSEVQSRSSSESTDGERALELTRRKKQAVAVPQQETELVTNKVRNSVFIFYFFPLKKLILSD